MSTPTDPTGGDGPDEVDERQHDLAVANDCGPDPDAEEDGGDGGDPPGEPPG